MNNLIARQSLLWVPLWSVMVLLAAPAVFAQAGQADSATADLYYKLQQVEQELMGLRGKLEEQENVIRKLRKQRLDDYQRLDQRIGALGGMDGRSTASAPRPLATNSAPRSKPRPQSRPASKPRPKPSNAPVSASSQMSGQSSSNTGADPALEKVSYSAAHALVKAEQFDDALPAFKDFILLYPNGQYTPNAHYWLGELYLYKADLDRAIMAFNTVVQNYPQHQKTPDSLFKLGKAHHILGDRQTARIMLNRVINDHSESPNAVRLAKDYIETELGG